MAKHHGEMLLGCQNLHDRQQAWLLYLKNISQACSMQLCFFFSGEGPRSRSYGRTAAMRLIVQPYDEDEDDDDYFLSFS
jgi:hypothetical protein